MNEKLKGNLAAIASVDRALYDRICLPVDGSHIECHPDGTASYRVRNQSYLFDLNPAELSKLGQLSVVAKFFVFGIGLGEQTAYLLEHFPAAQVLVWDLDPWLMRLALERHDFSAAITSHRLRLLMCSDLIDALPLGSDTTRVLHPHLQEHYRFERRLLDGPRPQRVALVCSGELFVDDLVDGLEQAGLAAFSIELGRWSIEELRYTVEHLSPELICAINYFPGLAEFCHSVERPLVVWEIDPTPRRLGHVGVPTEHCHIFTYRKANVVGFSESGFANAEYLPLAASSRRAMPALSDQDRQRYGAKVSYVGRSIVLEAGENRRALIADYQRLTGRSEAEATEKLSQVVQAQRQNFSVCKLPELMAEHMGDYLRASAHATLDPLVLVGEIAASEKRASTVASLAQFGIEVWGDEGWRALEPFGVRFRGRALHGDELTRVYAASQVSIDIGRIYQSDIVTMRVFDVLACGGLVLAEYSDALAELFVVGEEIEAYRTLDELSEKVKFYLGHPESAEKIAARGRQAISDRHNTRTRVQYMLSRLRSSAN